MQNFKIFRARKVLFSDKNSKPRRKSRKIRKRKRLWAPLVSRTVSLPSSSYYRALPARPYACRAPEELCVHALCTPLDVSLSSMRELVNPLGRASLSFSLARAPPSPLCLAAVNHLSPNCPGLHSSTGSCASTSSSFPAALPPPSPRARPDLELFPKIPSPKPSAASPPNPRAPVSSSFV